jgi:UDP-N-acetylglucosamine--N-acetylmuramyl-(pentapeptide) pyrophosphoryl-undecaprenol N-acetylglucosamine transferase
LIIFFTSPIGLGHASRDIAICEQISSIKKEQIVFITGQPATKIISEKGYNVYDSYKHPNFHVDDSMQLRSIFSWLLKYVLYYRKCKTIASGIFDSYKDALILSDEDFASIAVGEKRNRNRILITDLTQTHFINGFFSILEEKMNKSLRSMINNCNHVIIPDHGENKDNTSFVGPIVRELSTTNRELLRKKFGMDKPTILVSIGGTPTGKFLIEKAIKAYCNLRNKIDAEMIIASGPTIHKTELTNSIKNIGFVPNLHEYVYASDLVVSLAGRSTIDECVVYGTPGIFIPIKNHFEQEQNASRFGYTYEDIFRLESLVESKIGTEEPKREIGRNGARNAAKIILGLLEP